MFKNKKAFTLAEVLITLGIIGVVAALSTPALIQHAANAKVGPALSRGISIVSQSLQAFMHENDSDTLLGADVVTAQKPTELFTEIETKYARMKKDGAELIEICTDSFGTDCSIAASGYTVFLLNDKSALYIPTADCNPAVATDGCVFYFLPIGWTNKKFPTIGEDAFELAYDNKGNVKVYGLDYGDKWEDVCDDENIKNFAPGKRHKSCGGRIVAKGFKKDY